MGRHPLFYRMFDSQRYLKVCSGTTFVKPIIVL